MPALAILLITATFFLPLEVAAAYKCESPDGQIMFTDQPCPSGQKSESITIEKKEKSTYQALPRNCSHDEVADKVDIGMSSSEAYDACGYPDDINRTETAYGVHEQWVYGDFPYTAYIYVENEVVTSIQD